METKKGIVGFVDILGYKNIIEKNDIEKLGSIMQEILNLAKDVNDIVKNDLKNQATKDRQYLDFLDKHYKDYEIEAHVISDSIILLGEFNEADDFFSYIKFMIYIRFLQKLCHISFKKGIALIGAISYGEYIYENNIFASKALMEAHQLSEKLDFSGIAMCDEFKSFCKENVLFSEALDKNTSEIYCPLKNGSEDKLLIIDWISGLDEKDYTSQNGDLRQYIFNSFSKHNKDISQNVIKKIDNTENILRKILAKKS